MNSATDEALEKIVRAYFTARQAIAMGKPSAKVMQEFDETASRVFFNARCQDNESSPARIEHKKLRALLVTYEPDGIEKPAFFSFSWLRPLFYCFTGSLCCVALLIVANHGG
jgi:hypothetical protein